MPSEAANEDQERQSERSFEPSGMLDKRDAEFVSKTESHLSARDRDHASQDLRKGCQEGR